MTLCGGRETLPSRLRLELPPTCAGSPAMSGCGPAHLPEPLGMFPPLCQLGYVTQDLVWAIREVDSLVPRGHENGRTHLGVPPCDHVARTRKEAEEQHVYAVRAHADTHTLSLAPPSYSPHIWAPGQGPRLREPTHFHLCLTVSCLLGLWFSQGPVPRRYR